MVCIGNSSSFVSQEDVHLCIRPSTPPEYNMFLSNAGLRRHRHNKSLDNVDPSVGQDSMLRFFKCFQL
eukprot:scaffold421223_cov47-Attheya_sp.AAC.3